MASAEDYAGQPVGQRLERLRRTAYEITAAIGGRGEEALARRPDPTSWAPKEIVCHLRDIEELALFRYRAMLASDDPPLLVVGVMPTSPEAWGLEPGDALPLDADRWAEDRQYLRHDPAAALAAFGRYRDATLKFLSRLTEAQWQRGGRHPSRGRLTFHDWVAALAAHDDTHLAQLRRALDGRP
jgi:DinB family protein